MSADESVARLADLEAIRDLARRYAHYVWQQDVPAAIELYTEDGEWDTGEGDPVVGRENLLALYGETVGREMFHPFVHNHIIEIDGDHATGVCYLDLRAIVDGQSVMGSGYYDDRYARVNGVWKFKSRKLNMAYMVPPGTGWDQGEGTL